ncbi:MAG: sigma-70 family RNA polymerase sigma factor [Verrucomicrobia bacterium]|nr:sigma-70 family RNA polymerase sigma factor [Verrucomicrobiota bacterium]
MRTDGSEKTFRPPEATAFNTTHWSVVLNAGDEAAPQANAALAQLCETYWPPLYAFLRRDGHDPANAEDLVQGFFECFLERKYLHDVDRERGRFRSFLLAALRHYVMNERRDARTQRRGGGATQLTFDVPGVAERCEAAAKIEQEPHLIFDRVWAETIMENAARRLRANYSEAEKTQLYETLRVWLATEARPGDYAVAAQTLGVSEGAIAVAVHRLRQNFRRLVRAEVAHTVSSPAEVDEEMRHLLRVLTTS